MGNIHSDKKRIQFNIITHKENAVQLLSHAESKDFYLEECFDNDSNTKARSKCNYTPNNISPSEYNYIRTYYQSVYEKIPLRLCNDLSEINIIQLMPTADGGMTHTRPDNIICYPIISQIYSLSTLIHELWHIHQRLYKPLWDTVFKRIGWTQWNGELPDDLEKYRRYNPDTIDSPLWIFQDKWVPIPIFHDIRNPNMNDVDIWFYNPNKNIRVRKIPDELYNYFEDLPSVAFEHPREITAYMLSEHDKYKNTMAFKHLVEEIGYISISV